MRVTGRSSGSVRDVLASDLSRQGGCHLDFSKLFHGESSFGAFEPARLLLSVLRAGSVSLRVYRAGDRLVRSILR